MEIEVEFPAPEKKEKEKELSLTCSDGKIIRVDEKVAFESVTIKHLFEQMGSNTIPLPNVTGNILQKVIEYCKKHSECSKEAAGNLFNRSTAHVVELEKWDEDFVKVDQSTLFDLIEAANYLNVQALLDLTCKTVADMMKGKTAEQIRETFHIKNDYSAAEEEEVRRENAWAFMP